MDLVTKILSAAGAKSGMMHSAYELAKFSDWFTAIYFDLGVITPLWLPAIRLAARVDDVCRRKPWVMDPVVSGSLLRECLDLLALRPHVVRGDEYQILALFKASLDKNYKGVDALLESTTVIEAAKSLARSYRTIIVVSGAVSIVTDGKRVVGVKNGVPLLQEFAATGRALSALIAAFIAVNRWKPFEATACAISLFGVACEVGIDSTEDLASLQMHLIDALCSLDKDDVLESVDIFDISCNDKID